MKTTSRIFASFAFVAIIATLGCGGGGGGSASNGWLTFSPASSEVTAYFGESTLFRVTATSSRTISGVVNIGIFDSRGVLDPNMEIVSNELSYTAELHTSPTLAVGDYSGHLELRLCRDNPVVCAQPIDGSPWRVPYRLRVLPATSLTPLAALSGVGDWTTYQGNAAHTGFVNATLDPSRFNRRWSVPADVGSIATLGDKVFYGPRQNGSGAAVALAEHNGSEIWRYGGPGYFSGVATGEGRVWFVNESTSGPPYEGLRGLDATNGSVQVEVPLVDYVSSRRLAPVVTGGSVFVAHDSYNTIGRYRASDGAVEWTSLFTPAKSAAEWSPSVGGGRAVMFDYHRLWSADSASGTSQGSIEGPNASDLSSAWQVYGGVALSDGPLAFVSAYYSGTGTAYGNGRLVAFNLDTRAVAWNVGTTVRSNPVLVGNVVYVSVSGGDLGALEARDAATGALLWRWDAPSGSNPNYDPPNQPLIVVGNHAFIGLRRGETHAINLTTRQSVWSYPAAGPMAVSANGTLFIGSLTRLHAINLR